MPPDTHNTDILNQLGVSMQGIYPDGKCPVCHGTFKSSRGGLYTCPLHNTRPSRFVVSISYEGERIKRYTDLEGNTLNNVAQAHALIQQAKREIQQISFDPAKWRSKESLQYQFNILIEKWYKIKIDKLNEGRLSWGYVPKVRGYINTYFMPFFNNTDVRKIFTLRDFARQLPKTLSVKYRLILCDTLCSFFRWLYDERMLTVLPKFPERELPDEKLPTIISRQTQLDILHYIPDQHKPLFAFLFFQGCRPGEARALQWRDIDGDTIWYRRTWSGRRLQERTKSKRIRPNYLFPETKAYMPTRSFEMAFVFTHNGKPYSDDMVQGIWQQALQNFNIENKTTLEIGLYNATKHSFGTQFINEHPEHEKILQEHFGHTSAKMTAVYARLKTVDAMRKIDTVCKLSVASRKCQ